MIPNCVGLKKGVWETSDFTALHFFSGNRDFVLRCFYVIVFGKFF